MNYVYILRCADDTLYCGWTTNLTARVAAHNGGRGAKYTRSRLPVELVHYEEYEDRHDALSREWHVKRMSREEKIKLIGVEHDGPHVVFRGTACGWVSPGLPDVYQGADNDRNTGQGLNLCGKAGE